MIFKHTQYPKETMKTVLIIMMTSCWFDFTLILCTGCLVQVQQGWLWCGVLSQLSVQVLLRLPILPTVSKTCLPLFFKWKVQHTFSLKNNIYMNIDVWVHWVKRKQDQVPWCIIKYIWKLSKKKEKKKLSKKYQSFTLFFFSDKSAIVFYILDYGCLLFVLF